MKEVNCFGTVVAHGALLSSETEVYDVVLI